MDSKAISGGTAPALETAAPGMAARAETSLLTLDLATWTGFAFWRPGMDRPRSGEIRLPKTGSDIGTFLWKLKAWLLPFMQMERPGVVIYEAPVLQMGKTTPETVIKLMCLAGFTEYLCKEAGVKTCLSVNNAQVRKHFTGRGNGPREIMKEGVVLACERMGWPVDGDNEADALGILHYAAHCLKINVPWDSRACPGGMFNTLKGRAA